MKKVPKLIKIWPINHFDVGAPFTKIREKMHYSRTIRIYSNTNAPIDSPWLIESVCQELKQAYSPLYMFSWITTFRELRDFWLKTDFYWSMCRIWYVSKKIVDLCMIWYVLQKVCRFWYVG